jgi:hypothetical protein
MGSYVAKYAAELNSAGSRKRRTGASEDDATCVGEAKALLYVSPTEDKVRLVVNTDSLSGAATEISIVDSAGTTVVFFAGTDGALTCDLMAASGHFVYDGMYLDARTSSVYSVLGSEVVKACSSTIPYLSEVLNDGFSVSVKTDAGCAFVGGITAYKIKGSEVVPAHFTASVTELFGVYQPTLPAPVVCPDCVFPACQFPPSRTVSVITIASTDADAGSNASVTYSLGGELQDKFYVCPTTGVVAAIPASIDREQTPSFTLTVVATDAGGLATESSVLVSVVDINDNSPKCEAEFAHPVDEGVTGSVYALADLCSDKDQLGPHSELGFTATGDAVGSVVAVSTDGIVTLTSELDFEGTDAATSVQFEVTVVNKDTDIMDNLGSPIESAKIAFSVASLDINDNAPTFNEEFTARVSECDGAGSAVVTLTSTDKDVTVHAPRYALAEPSNIFALDPATGALPLTATRVRLR